MTNKLTLTGDKPGRFLDEENLLETDPQYLVLRELKTRMARAEVEEAKKAKAFARSILHADTSGDGKISADELAAALLTTQDVSQLQLGCSAHGGEGHEDLAKQYSNGAEVLMLAINYPMSALQHGKSLGDALIDTAAENLKMKPLDIDPDVREQVHKLASMHMLNIFQTWSEAHHILEIGRDLPPELPTRTERAAGADLCKAVARDAIKKAEGRGQ